MRLYNTNANLIKIIKKNLHDKATSVVYFNSNIEDWFRTTAEVKQGCLLSPTLFNIFLERIMANALKVHEGTVRIGSRTITNLRFADDIVGLAGKEKELANLVDCLDKISTSHGMQINAEKSKLMTNDIISFTTDSRIGGKKLDIVNSFKYLGAIVTDEGSKPEILAGADKIKDHLDSKIRVMHSLVIDHISNEEVCDRIRRTIGPHDDLLTVVEKTTSEDSPAGHSSRREEERQAEKEMGNPAKG
ncbi:hypothetical protein M9458_035315 [Cirrhinus mrigala]|uniref:Reverse transcriptase domain-containing protein n=1 Tax=Cirrhinus mrigala TaxID=683832 RepID=A0ABD0P9F2_CIRMR